MKYRPEIDGLRAVAVLPVVAFHAGMSVLSGGFAGVDVFFVISGFLITTIIAEEAERGRFSIGRFYDRRARRILPALLLVMLVTLPFAFAVMVPYQLEDLAQSIVATLLFLSNVLFWREADYFAIEAATKPLLHTWSLAVEEQFYLFFPLILAGLYRISRRAVIPVLAALFVLSFALALLYGYSAPSATFFLIQFRAWELMAGALAALWMRRAPPAPNPWIAGAGLAAVVLSFFVATEEGLWPGPVTLLPVLGTAALLVFARAEGGVGRWLAWRPVRGIGLISYSLYLWHLPPLALLAIVYYGETPALASALAVVVAFLGAWVSWAFIERPFRIPGKVRLAPFAGIMTAAMAPLLVFGVMGVQSAGFQSWMTARIPERFAGQVIDREAEVAAREEIWGPLAAEAARPFDEDGGRRVLILGDSLSGDLIVATGGHAERFPGVQFRRQRLDDPCMGEAATLLAAGALPEPEDAPRGRSCEAEVPRVLGGDLVRQADEIVLAANWQPETVEGGVALGEALAAQGKTVNFLGVAAFNDMASLSMRLHRINEPVESFFYRNIRSKFVPVNARMRAAAEGTEGLRYLDKLGLYCDPDTRACDLLDDGGKPLIFDSAHVTTRGVEAMSERIARAGWFE